MNRILPPCIWFLHLLELTGNDTKSFGHSKRRSVIAAEDTRNTKLLMAYGIDTMLMSHHEHNQQTSIPKIIERLENGEDVAVVSDAGYPLVSGSRTEICSRNNFTWI